MVENFNLICPYFLQYIFISMYKNFRECINLNYEQIIVLV